MNVFEAVLLGVVQGATEFLPISSDGHLAVVYHMLGKRPDLTFEVFLHAATLLAMLAYFRDDLASVAQSLVSRKPEHARERRLALRIAGVTAVSAVVALAISPVVEPAAESLGWIAGGFLLTSALMLAGEILGRARADADGSTLTAPALLLVGALQGLAALPGVSRSGSTISAGMFSGLSRESAARFSFLCGIPIIALAAGRDAVRILAGSTSLPGLTESAAGFLAAGVSGYLAIAALLRLVKRHGLWVFSAYTALLGAGMLMLAARS